MGNQAKLIKKHEGQRRGGRVGQGRTREKIKGGMSDKRAEGRRTEKKTEDNNTNSDETRGSARGSDCNVWLRLERLRSANDSPAVRGTLLPTTGSPVKKKIAGGETEMQKKLPGNKEKGKQRDTNGGEIDY